MKKSIITLSLLLALPVAALRAQTDSVYVNKQTLEFSELYTLYYQENGVTKNIYEIDTEDGSSIIYQYHYQDNDIDYECFSVNNNSADCDKYIFFNRKTKIFYITKTCFPGYDVEQRSVNFKKDSIFIHSAVIEIDKPHESNKQTNTIINE